MKICPTCRKTYPDDGLNFCLDDGTVLTFASADLPETVMMQQPLPTNPSVSSPPPTSPAIGSQPTWNQPHQFSMQPPAKKSRAWLWVVGIFGIGLLLCGGAGVLFIGLAIYNTPAEDDDNDTKPPVATDKSPVPGASPFPGASVQKADLSKWVGTSEHGTVTYADGELVMASAKQNYYYAVCAADDFKTENAAVRVNLRNLSSGSTDLGYGLIFHSNPAPLQQGYALLIDTNKKRYRVVRHEPKKQLVVVNWTNSDAIKDGSEVNKLEVRHKNNVNELFINDKMVTSVRNIYGFKGGVAGLYTGDGIKIGFRDLEIVK